MIEAMEKQGIITPGKTVLIEPTSGNTGIALAFVAAAKGYKLILVMPESMSLERRKMLMILGAQIELTEAAKGMKGAIARAHELVASHPGAVIPQQFENPANPEIHRQHHGGGNLERHRRQGGYRDLRRGHRRHHHRRRPGAEGQEAFGEDDRAGAGRFPGPVGRRAGPAQDSGHRRGLRARHPGPQGDRRGHHHLQRDRAGNRARAAREEGIPVGISSGAAIAAALEVGARPENAGKTIVAIIPSFAERYLSTALFEGVDKSGRSDFVALSAGRSGPVANRR